MLCRAVPCRAVPCRAVPCRAVPCRAVPCRAVPCRAVPCRAVPCRAVLYTVLIIHGTVLGAKSSEDEPKLPPSDGRKKRALSARETRSALSPRVADNRRNLPSYKHLINGDNLVLCDVGPSSDEYLGPWGRRRSVRQQHHQGAGEPYLARPLPRHAPEQLCRPLMQPNAGSRSGLLRSLGRSHDTTFRMTEFLSIPAERDTSASSQVINRSLKVTDRNIGVLPDKDIQVFSVVDRHYWSHSRSFIRSTEL